MGGADIEQSVRGLIVGDAVSLALRERESAAGEVSGVRS